MLKCNCLGRKGTHNMGLEGCTRKVAVGSKIPTNQRRIDTEYGPIIVWDLEGEIITDTKLFSDLGYAQHRTIPSWSYKLLK